jgi:outer membrane protein OmpA-like peptidoglycan-associated protein
MTRTGFLGLASMVVLAGCATKTQTGAVVGAAGGAVVGGAVGAAAGSTAKGAIIGAVVGGVAGTIIGAQMDKQAKELEQNIKGAKVERVGEGIQVTFESGLLYDFDSDVVRPEAQANLRELAASLDKYTGSDVLIVGHTDALGTSSYNQSLSERRAGAASAYLAGCGAGPDPDQGAGRDRAGRRQRHRGGPPAEPEGRSGDLRERGLSGRSCQARAPLSQG